MMRGSTGLGVWKLENVGAGERILMTDAYNQTTEEIARSEVIPRFLSLCKEDAISMPFLPLIKDGEFRFLMSKHKVSFPISDDVIFIYAVGILCARTSADRGSSSSIIYRMVIGLLPVKRPKIGPLHMLFIRLLETTLLDKNRRHSSIRSQRPASKFIY